MLASMLAGLALCPQGPGTSTAPVVINEFQYDDAGTDNYEFVELYNRSAAPVDISLWVVVNRDPGSTFYGGTGGTDPTHLIPTGTVLQPGQFYVVGNIAVTNVNLVIPTNGIENDNESVELRDSLGMLIDAVSYELTLGNFGPFPNEGDGFFGELFQGEAGGLLTGSIARVLDGYDNDDNGRDFTAVAVPTPGTTNVSTTPATMFDLFDSGISTNPVPGWNSAFVTPGTAGPRYADPTVIDSANLSAKPASPQGGLAMVWHDNSGGGNGVQLHATPQEDIVLECYAYISPTMAPLDPLPFTSCGAVTPGTYEASAGEWWGIGVRGSTSSRAYPDDVPGSYFTTIAPVATNHRFNSGIAWVHYRTTAYSQLFLVDFGNGDRISTPNDFRIIGGPINIVQGVNDGWQRLRIHAQGDKVIGNFGGLFGFDDGVRFSGNAVSTGPGAVWLGYREAMCNNALFGHPMIDMLDIHTPTTLRTTVGTPTATTVGTPLIDSDGYAIVGSTGFAVTASHLVPFGAPNYQTCGMVIGFNSFAQGYQIPGAPPGTLAYVFFLVNFFGQADSNGEVRFPLPIPADNNLLGVVGTVQAFDFDTLLNAPLRIAVTSALEFTIGR